MCGVCGLVRRGGITSSDKETIAQMIEALSHRGPDGSGREDFGCATLGHVRLDIGETRGGVQPVCNDEGTVCVTFSGAIHNLIELTEHLSKLGHRFRTSSEAEAIVHAYEQYGAKCVRHLRGMFTFAVWDERKTQLLLVRDRLGQKPLSYAEVSGGIVFGSESSALMAAPGVSRDLSPEGLAEFINYGFITAPVSIYRQVRSLRPGHIATYRDGTLSTECYWGLEFTQNGPRRTAEALEALQEVVEEAVQLRMATDVSAGAFLSGGVDSSLVAGVMRKLSGSPVKTFCMGFAEEHLDESRHAQAASEALGTEHHLFTMPAVTPELVEDVAKKYPEPFADSSAIPTYALVREARRHVKVVFDGTGGDEAFGGFGRYYSLRGLRTPENPSGALRRCMIEVLPAWLYPPVFGLVSGVLTVAGLFVPAAREMARSTARLAAPLDVRYWAQREVFGHRGVDPLLAAEGREIVSPPEPSRTVREAVRMHRSDPLAALQHAEIVGVLANGHIPKMEVAAAAVGLEIRSPLLDHKVVEFAASLSPDMRANSRMSKFLLRKLAARYLPRQILERGKQGFTPPRSTWLNSSLQDLTHEYLLSGGTSRSGLFSSEAVREMVVKGNGVSDSAEATWRLLMFELWHEQHGR